MAVITVPSFPPRPRRAPHANAKFHFCCVAEAKQVAPNFQIHGQWQLPRNGFIGWIFLLPKKVGCCQAVEVTTRLSPCVASSHALGTRTLDAPQRHRLHCTRKANKTKKNRIKDRSDVIIPLSEQIFHCVPHLRRRR